MPTTVEGKIEEATALKLEGNGHVKAQQYKKGCSCYLRAAMFITGPGFSGDSTGMGALTGQSDGAPKLTPEQTQVVADLLFSMNGNLALCFLKEEKYDKAVAKASKVLEVDAENAKALFRRGTARMMLNDYDRARADLETAEKLSPEDKQIKKSLANMNKRLKQHERGRTWRLPRS